MSLFLLALLLAGSQPLPPAPDFRHEYRLGSRLPQVVPTSQRKSGEVRQIQFRYGVCVVKKHAVEARQYVLMTGTEDPNYKKVTNVVVDGECLLSAAAGENDMVMELPGDTLRYALADALVRKDIIAPWPGVANATSIVQPKIDEADYLPKPDQKVSSKLLADLATQRQRETTRVYVSEFGECVVRKVPAQSFALLMSEPVSAGENVALQGIASSLGGCTTAGQTITFTRTVLRGTIAMNYYRWAARAGLNPPQAQVAK